MTAADPSPEAPAPKPIPRQEAEIPDNDDPDRRAMHQDVEYDKWVDAGWSGF